MSINTNTTIDSDDLLKTIDDLQIKVKEATKGARKWYDKVGVIAELVVPQIEEIGTKAETFGRLSGSQKKELALNLVEMVYFRMFDSKYLPNFIEAFMVRRLASFVIDLVVKVFNETGIFKHFNPLKPSV